MAEEPIGEAKVVVRIETAEAERRLEEARERRKRDEEREAREESRGQGDPSSALWEGPEWQGDPAPSPVEPGVGTETPFEAAVGGGRRTVAVLAAARTALIGGGLVELLQMTGSATAGFLESDVEPGSIEDRVLTMAKEYVDEQVALLGKAQAGLKAALSTVPQLAALVRGRTLLRGEVGEDEMIDVATEIFQVERARQELNEAQQKFGREQVGAAVRDYLDDLLRRNDGG